MVQLLLYKTVLGKNAMTTSAITQINITERFKYRSNHADSAVLMVFKTTDILRNTQVHVILRQFVMTQPVLEKIYLGHDSDAMIRQHRIIKYSFRTGASRRGS